MTRGQNKVRIGWLIATISLFLFLASYQLGLPGLHYDEAKEAGVNAIELLHRAPVTAFRSATVSVMGLDLPLMVQDYIGALNVYLALPFLAATGIGVPNLRLLALTLAVLGMLALERSVSEWIALCCRRQVPTAPIAPAALVCLTLLAAAPSFVFWQRQGIFVTNTTFPFTFACIWQGLRWLRLGENRALILSAFCGGLAIYAKLLAIWVVLPFGGLCMIWWLRRRAKGALRDDSGVYMRRHTGNLERGRKVWVFAFRPIGLPLFAALAFAIPLIPLIVFNMKTGGTLSSIFQNLGSSYYGVDNAAIWKNVMVRWQQLLQTLRGDHFWYLGALEGNALSPLAALGLPAAALLRRESRRVVGPLLLLLAAAFGASLFTVSDLFVTHYALLHPLAIAVAAAGLHELWRWRDSRVGSGVDPKGFSGCDGPQRRSHFGKRFWDGLRAAKAGQFSVSRPGTGTVLQAFLALLLCAVVLLDLRATIGYHRALTRSGGLIDHSDASYRLATDLRYGGMGAPIVLDWGIEAPVRFLSEGNVRPIEIFGYSSLQEPDTGFTDRLAPFLENFDNVYLLRAPGNEVFQGRRAAFERMVDERNGRLEREEIYTQLDGTPLYERWRVQD